MSSVLVWKDDLRRWNGRRHLLQAGRLNVILEPIDAKAKLAGFGINHSPHPVGATKWLVHFETVPGVDRDSVVPPNPKLGHPAILRLEFQSSYLLEGILLGVPFHTEVINRLLLQVLEQLCAEGVGDFVLHVKVAKFLGDDIDWGVILDMRLLELLLLLTDREYAKLGDVITEAVSRLRVLRHGDHLTQ